MKRKLKILTPQELAIMKIVWQFNTATVRDVYEALREKRRIAYTTVMTMMKILEGKGFLKKWQEGRAYVYKPTSAEKKVVSDMLTEFVNRVFSGSAEALVLSLFEDTPLSCADQAKIKKLIAARNRKSS